MERPISSYVRSDKVFPVNDSSWLKPEVLKTSWMHPFRCQTRSFLSRLNRVCNLPLDMTTETEKPWHVSSAGVSLALVYRNLFWASSVMLVILIQ